MTGHSTDMEKKIENRKKYFPQRILFTKNHLKVRINDSTHEKLENT